MTRDRVQIWQHGRRQFLRFLGREASFVKVLGELVSLPELQARLEQICLEVGLAPTSCVVWPVADERRETRLVLVGDFNSTPTSFAFARLEAALPLSRATTGLMTFPAGQGVFGFRPPAPLLAIDHVFAGRDLTSLRAARGPDLGSDHYPVVVRLGPTASEAKGRLS